MGSNLEVESLKSEEQSLYDCYVTASYRLSDMKGKVVAITGTTEGSIGYYTALAAVSKGAKLLLLLNRDTDRSYEAEQKIKAHAKATDQECFVRTVVCDLSNLYLVKNAALAVNETVADGYGGLDVLVNCAGVCALPDERTVDGFDVQMQVNMLSHFLLTKLLMDSLELAAETRGEARVVMHTCAFRGIPNRMLKPEMFQICPEGTLGGDGKWFLGDLVKQKGPFSRYQQSKLANASFSMALHMKLQAVGSKVKSIVVDPGFAKTNLFGRNSTSSEPDLISKTSARFRNLLSQSPANGSIPTLVASFGPANLCQSGDFFLRVAQSTGLADKSVAGGVPVKRGGERLACHPLNIECVWTSCEKVLQVKFDISRRSTYKMVEDDSDYVSVDD
uniref:Protochlorophyllide reductase n=1 Tax=Leptocylindrus danicus TaxID=163516 RepID=A0A7S2KDW4_9STRA|mmetsp:Transcript_2176/g.3197  ORF Transcript_2176/g.3197 Transcript_2176/m.3197 type:complete len:390 (+) Transcript_2176:122-1291(+)